MGNVGLAVVLVVADSLILSLCLSADLIVSALCLGALSLQVMLYGCCLADGCCFRVLLLVLGGAEAPSCFTVMG